MKNKQSEPRWVAGPDLRRWSMRRTQQRINDLMLRRVTCAPYMNTEAAIAAENRVYDAITQAH